MKNLINRIVTTVAPYAKAVKPSSKTDWKFVGVGAGATVGSVLVARLVTKVARKFMR